MPSFASTFALSFAAVAVLTTGTNAAGCGKSVSRKVLAPGYRLGAVVNLADNEVLDGSFWTEGRIAENMETVDVDSVRTEISSVTSLIEKANIVDISGALAIDLFTAGITGKGSGGFVTDSSASATTAEVVYHTERTTQSDFIKEELMSELMSFNRFFAVKEATHVVTRVTYGGSVFISFSEASDSIEQRDGLNAALSIEIKKLKLSGSASIVLDEKTKSKFQNLKLKVISDLPLTQTPLTIEDVNSALAGIPEAFQRVNNGRGIPLEVTLTPICVWSTDIIGTKLRQITEDAVTEILNVMQAVFSGVAAAKGVGFKAGVAGMPVLKSQAEDFAQTLDRFASSVRVRLAQLLPSIRNSLVSQIAAITFTSKLRQSPFNYLALRRWMETANEDILEQNRLRANLANEAKFPVGHPEAGQWINRKVYFINSFPELQQLLVNPDIETTMLLVTVNRNSGLQSHLDVMVDYMFNPPITELEIAQFPNIFDKAKWLEAPDNAFRTRGNTVNMARWAGQTDCVLSGCLDAKNGETLAMIDYNSFVEEFLSMGLKIDRTTVLLYRNGRLVNTDFNLCPSPNDPRDDEGFCLWRGEGDIPNGFSCALERPQGGCEGVCGLDGRCRNFECSVVAEVPVKIGKNEEAVNDWHKIRLHPDAVVRDPSMNPPQEDGIFEEDLKPNAGFVNKCLAFTPDTSRGLQIEDCQVSVATQRWRWGSGLEKQHIKSERETTLCMQAVLYVDDEDENTNGNGPASGGTSAPTFDALPTKAPTNQPTDAPTMYPTTTESYLKELSDISYGHVEMRQCSPFNPMQFFQRYTVDYDTPHLMLRPPVVQSYDYIDLCVKFFSTSRGQTGIKLVKCAANSLHQAVYETSAWRYYSPKGPNNKEVQMTKPRYAQFNEPVVRMVDQFLDSKESHFFWEGSYLRPWFDKTSNGALTKNYYLNSNGGTITVIPYPWEGVELSPSPFFKVGSQFHTIDAGERWIVQVQFWDVTANLPLEFDWDILSVKANEQRNLYKADDVLVNGNLLQCPDLCEPLTCSEQGKKNAECFTASNTPICTCRAGWGGLLCETQVNACIDNECEIDEFCTDLMPPAGNTANDRTCQPITMCKVNEFLARSNSTVSDAACSPCPVGTIQPEFNIKEVGDKYCVTVLDTITAIIEKDFPEAKLPVLPDEAPGVPPNPVAVKLQTEAELKKLCEDRNSYFFPSKGDKIGPRCSSPGCDKLKKPVCSDLGCECVYRVAPQPVQSESEFALLLAGSGAIGLVAAVAVVIVVDALIKFNSRAAA